MVKITSIALLPEDLVLLELIKTKLSAKQGKVSTNLAIRYAIRIAAKQQ